MAKKKDKTYRAGAYKRLSQDDGRGEVSNSIINQDVYKRQDTVLC